ncbi:RES family NAD+ phosphorylase [Roseateles sp. GG27B]
MLTLSVKLWRIAAETRKYAATDLSGAGAAVFPGRWNSETQPVVYCAQSIAVAVLETAAHLDDAGLPLNRFVVEIDVPAALWASRETIVVAQLPATWSAIPAGRASILIGSAWLAAQRSALLLLPSVIVPEEFIVLINPLHPSSSQITAQAVRVFEYGKLFRR